jgi:hypothetical protein
MEARVRAGRGEGVEWSGLRQGHRSATAAEPNSKCLM